MLDKILGKNFGADMATKMIVDLMKKAKEEKGTESIVITVQNDTPVLIEYKFHIPDKFLQAKEAIEKQRIEIDCLSEEIETLKDVIDSKNIELNDLVEEIKNLNNDKSNRRDSKSAS